MIEVPRSEIIQRVFAITPDKKSCGSSLAFAVNGVFYFITAAHVLGNTPEGKDSKLYIFKDNDWLEADSKPFYVAGRPYQKGDIDIAVVKTNITSKDTEPKIVLSSGNMIIGQDAYFLGFPYFGGAINHRAESFNANFPIPFIKKAAISAVQDPIIYLDGHNNPGFSGGPVVFWSHSEQKNKVLGIISAYLTQEGEIKRVETSTKDFYRENSGIGIAYNIKYAEDLIKKIT